ncbi:MAG TPA: hypothetical protein VGJ91_11670, partial [Polyangiaceae bacterium]
MHDRSRTGSCHRDREDSHCDRSNHPTLFGDGVLMACVPIPDVPLPTLPDGITIAPTFPAESFDPSLCCKILKIPITTPPIAIPPAILNPGVNAAIATAIKGVQDYIDKLQHDCPKELQRPTS